MSKDNKKVTGDSIYRVKLYKDGKKWVAAGATTLALVAGLAFADVNANAATDTTNDKAQSEVVASPTKDDANVQDKTTDANDGAKAAGDEVKDTVAPVKAATVTEEQKTPEVTAPASAAPATSDAVTKQAALSTGSAAQSAPASTETTVVSDASQAGQVVAGANKTNNIHEEVLGTAFTAQPKTTYTSTVTLTKNPELNWNVENTTITPSQNLATGKFTVKPGGASTNSKGTWTAKDYVVYNGTKQIATGTATSVDTFEIPVAQLIDATSLKFTYNYALNKDVTDATPVDSLYIDDVPSVFSGEYAGQPYNQDPSNGWSMDSITTHEETTEKPGTPNTKVNVTVSYQDAQGNTIQKDAVEEQNDVGGAYKVMSPATITGYTYDDAATQELNKTEGTIDAEGNNIVLVYVADPAAKTDLTVNYQTAKGAEVQPSNTYTEGVNADGVTTPTEVGGTYSVTAPEVAGYTYKGYTINGGALQSGNVAADKLAEKGQNVVTFVYAKVVTVTVNYLDEQGNKIADPTSTSYEVGDKYTVDTPATITKDGVTYTYKDADTDLAGTVDKNGATVNLYYTAPDGPVTPEKEASQLTVNYVDENGKALQDPTTQEGKVDDDYAVEAPVFENYDFDADSSDALTGKYVKGGSSITLVYKAKPVTPAKDQSTVTVKYVDENGKELQPSTTQKGDVDSDYTVSVPTIDGYTFNADKSDALTGKYVKDGSTVTLVFSAVTDPEKPTNPTDPEKPTTPTKPGEPDVVNPSTPDNGNKDVTTSNDDKVNDQKTPEVTPAETGKTTTPAQVTTTANDEVAGTKGVVANNNLKPVEAAKAATTSKSTTLPQTDEANGTALAVLGLGTMLMGSALYFGASRRKHEA